VKYNIMKRWVKALRSGKYKQIRGALNNGKGFCCLGVLCDISKKDLGIKWVKGYEDKMEIGKRHKDTDYLPKSVRRWAGIKTRECSFYDEASETECDLSLLNDNYRSFKYIAKVIEQYWMKL